MGLAAAGEGYCNALAAFSSCLPHLQGLTLIREELHSSDLPQLLASCQQLRSLALERVLAQALRQRSAGAGQAHYGMPDYDVLYGMVGQQHHYPPHMPHMPHVPPFGHAAAAGRSQQAGREQQGAGPLPPAVAVLAALSGLAQLTQLRWGGRDDEQLLVVVVMTEQICARVVMCGCT